MLSVVVSIDGLQPEHDERRKPATYERILKNISGTRVTIHCTITSQIATRAGYLDEFLGFWSSRPEIVRVWFSLFTPQRGATDAEILTPSMRASVIADLLRLRRLYPGQAVNRVSGPYQRNSSAFGPARLDGRAPAGYGNRAQNLTEHLRLEAGFNYGLD
jgi:hypothetical protein